MPDLNPPFRFGELRPSSIRALAVTTEVESPGASARLASLESAEFAAHRSRFKPLPDPTGPYPFRLRFRDLVGSAKEQEILNAGRIVFHSVGDTGQHGHGALAQERVALHMEQQLDNAVAGSQPAFFYHLGDVVYYNGELGFYPEQFYEPYQYYRSPILSIPGNHDGATIETFVQNFCTTTPEDPPMPGTSLRRTMTQPNVYFTLELPFITIIGLYSNVDGHLDRPGDDQTPQFDWLVRELREADPERFLIVAVHHPPYSADDHHGSARTIADNLDAAIEASGRLPHLVLTGHIHDFQYFKRTKNQGAVTGEIQYLVAGAGGYAGYESLHKVDENDVPDGVELKSYNDELPGFLRLSADAHTLKWEYFTTPESTGDDANLWQHLAFFTDTVAK
jgi:hypothetical protein